MGVSSGGNAPCGTSLQATTGVVLSGRLEDAVGFFIFLVLLQIKCSLRGVSSLLSFLGAPPCPAQRGQGAGVSVLPPEPVQKGEALHRRLLLTDVWVNGVNGAVLRARGHSATGDCVCVTGRDCRELGLETARPGAAAATSGGAAGTCGTSSGRAAREGNASLLLDPILGATGGWGVGCPCSHLPALQVALQTCWVGDVSRGSSLNLRKATGTNSPSWLTRGALKLGSHPSSWSCCREQEPSRHQLTPLLLQQLLLQLLFLLGLWQQDADPSQEREHDDNVIAWGGGRREVSPWSPTGLVQSPRAEPQ